MDGRTELRKVPAAALNHIAEILDIGDAWKTVVSLIPKYLNSDRFEPKYNNEHIRLMEKHAQDNNLKFAMVLFEEWGSSGDIRPTLHTLLDVLVKAHMLRAADVLAKLINESPPQRPNEGPAAHICTNVTNILNSVSSEQNTEDLEEMGNRAEETAAGIHSVKRTEENAENCSTSANSNYNVPNFEAIGHHSTEMIPNRDNLSSGSESE